MEKNINFKNVKIDEIKSNIDFEFNINNKIPISIFNFTKNNKSNEIKNLFEVLNKYQEEINNIAFFVYGEVIRYELSLKSTKNVSKILKDTDLKILKHSFNKSKNILTINYDINKKAEVMSEI